MTTVVTMPVLGLTMEEGTVAAWLKQEGELVEKDEPLLTVEMDKGTVEVPSPAGGVLRRILVPVGVAVPVRAPIAELEAVEEDQPPAVGSTSLPPPEARAGGPGDLPARPPSLHQVEEATAAPEADAHRVAVAPVLGPAEQPNLPSAGAARPSAMDRGAEAAAVGGAPAGRLLASPRARLRARELGVDLAALAGRGPGERIVEEDVLHAASAAGVVAEPSAASAVGAAAAPSVATFPGVPGAEGPHDTRQPATPLARRLALEHGLRLSEVQGSGPAGRITHEDVLAAAERRAATARSAEAATSPTAIEGTQPLSRLRRVTAERMAQSARSVARVTLFLEADFTEAARFRQQLQPELARLGVPRLPWDALLARASGLALAEHPAVNAQWIEGHGLRTSQAAHVGVAVALEPEGLVVPVLWDAHRRSLRELAGDLLSLTERARSGRLTPADMQGGTFTITNLGAFRVDGFTPIVNPPEAAILGVGRIAEKPAVVDGRIEPRTHCTLSLSFDHRVVDGAPAAAFLARLAELLERPYALLGV